VNCDVIGFIALDEILGLFFAGMVGVAFQFYVGDQFLYDSAPDPACFRIPSYVIAAFERLGHLPIATESRMNPATQWSGGKRYLRCLQHHEEYRVLALAFDQPQALRTVRLY